LAVRYDEQVALMNDRAAAFHWQGLASNVMLWVVALVVLSGLSFTGLQLECDALWHRHADKQEVVGRSLATYNFRIDAVLASEADMLKQN
jgi:hypothetical protein